MGTRETYVDRFSCPGCGASGSATWEENATPPHHGGRLNPVLKNISKGFRRSGDSEDTTVECSKCRTPVKSR